MANSNQQPFGDSAVVLVIESDPILIHFISATIGKDGELTFSPGRPDNAIRLIRTERPNLVIIETPTPMGDGFDICERIRSICDVPIVVALDKRDENAVTHAIESGADDYIFKPIDSEELRVRIKAALLRRQQTIPNALQTTNTISFSDVLVDMNTGTIRKAGTIIDISPREYQLLLFFVCNPNRLLTSAEILKNVWGIGYEDSIDALRTAVNRLRGKVEPDPTRPKHIVSRRGLGYLFIPIALPIAT